MHILALFIALCSSAASQAEVRQALQESAIQVTRVSSNNAKEGFYLEIKRSYVRAYPGWQKRTIRLLRGKAFDAFNAEPKSRIAEPRLMTIECLVKTFRPRQLLSSVFTGPYPSGEAAEQNIPELLSALKPLIDDEKKNDELHNRALFLVGVVKVKYCEE